MEALTRLLGCLKLQVEEEQQSFDIPTEIITDNILPRLPVKSILRFRSVSKPWLSLISTPSFINRHVTLATTALFIPAVDTHTNKLFFLSAATGTSSLTLTHQITLNTNSHIVTDTEHLNGFVFCTTHGARFNSYEDSIVVNPSTRKTFNIPYRWRKLFKLPYRTDFTNYFFAFDESDNKHKVFRMMFSVGTATSVIELIEISLSDHKWREIDDSFDTGRTDLRSSDISGSVCVNSVMHWLLLRSFEILAFDLRTDAFSVVKVPLDDLRYDLGKRYGGNDLYFIKVNGCVGVVCSHRMVKANEMHIWILKDFENRVWVKETITIPESWDVLDCPMPLDCTYTGEIIFSVKKLSLNVISVPIYNMKSQCFKSVQFTLDHPLLRSQHVHFYQIKCYVESLMPL